MIGGFRFTGRKWSIIVSDPSLLAQFAKAIDPIEVRDPQGNYLGCPIAIP